MLLQGFHWFANCFPSVHKWSLQYCQPHSAYSKSVQSVELPLEKKPKTPNLLLSKGTLKKNNTGNYNIQCQGTISLPFSALPFAFDLSYAL